jgi:hypothetical protein
MSESKTMSNSDIQQAIDINDLSYIADNSSNLIVQRNQKKMYADSSSNSTANNRNIIINMQTGNDYISFKDSYLRLNITVKNGTGTEIKVDDTAWGPKGSVLNIFDNIKVITRGGTELSHDSRANLLNYYRVLYETSETWKETQQARGLIGWRQPIAVGKNEYMIPLSLLNSFFNQDQLTPNNVCRGLRLEMTLSDQIEKMLFLKEGVTVAAAADRIPAEIVVSDCELLLDSYRIDPRAQTILNEMSASETGLVLQYHDYERVGHDKPLGAASSSFEMRKTVSMANACFAVLRETVRDTEDGERELELDSFAGAKPTADHKYHWRLGSTYFPVNKIEGLTQWFAQNVYCSDKLRSGEEFGMNYDNRYVVPDGADYVGGVVPPNVGQSASTACVNIDRHFLDLSGLAINNSTTLNLLIDTPVNALQIDMFLKHTVRAVCFLENTEVKK